MQAHGTHAQAFQEKSAMFLAMIEQALDQSLTFEPSVSETLVSAMRYSALLPGKRIRPLLVLLACEACGGDAPLALPAASAIEMVHAFSLIHDDLPAMDDDDLRRGQPTNHKMFGEAQAILAGDGLLAHAFSVLATLDSPDAIAQCTRILAEAAGPQGMTGGQSIDMQGLPADATVKDVERLHTKKTGALIVAAVQMGAVIAGASPEKEAGLIRYGAALGLLFQMTDDLLDAVGDRDAVGKAVGKDAAQGKKTYPMLLGIEGARSYASELAEQATQELRMFGPEADALRGLVVMVRDRRS